MKRANERKNFEQLAARLLSVPHGELKSKLEAEKKAKERKKAMKSSASREAV